MKLLFYKVCLVFFTLTTINSFAQTTIYKNSFSAKSLDFNLKNIPVKFIESKDDKIHFNFSIHFKNYTHKQQDSIKSLFNFDIETRNNKLFVSIKSKNNLTTIQYINSEIKTKELSKILTKYVKSNIALNKEYQTKQDFLNYFNTEEKRIEDYTKTLKKDYSLKDNVLVSSPDFIISVPRKLLSNFYLNADNCNIKMNDLTLKQSKVFVNDSSIKIKKTENSNITIHNGTGFIKELESTIATLRNNSSFKIGILSNSNLITENTRLNIGEITKFSDIKDYNSKFIFNNFGSNFDTFNFKGEYSNLKIYPPKNDYTLKAYGNSCSFIINGITSKYGNKKGDKKYLMLKVKRKMKKDFAGNIKFDVINSIITFKDS
ncbi:hypothetical protein WH52_04830 [Tenacibaculum holothuriorum]|uniref:Adhesin domain-containing protein n=1 Tax=Tenacibaculum holothuriorum TaxID=1635173 RepID=A0A1Y2PH02_9FLAO|nr:hypothetical protein [Tenacibaculum holothuriorum]OSY88989.1 hypothetical protein WH52_04830 [Tenacibaculum holothuriorum]